MPTKSQFPNFSWNGLHPTLPIELYFLILGPSVIEFDPNVGFPRRDTRRPMKKPAEEDVKKVASEKSAKTLLGEFYKDREFLEQIASDQTLQSLDMNDQAESVLQIIRLVFYRCLNDSCRMSHTVLDEPLYKLQHFSSGIKFLDNKSDFWRQQKPMYTR